MANPRSICYGFVTSMPHPPRLRVCLVDMNNGVANQATRCFRRLVDTFSARVTEANPSLDVVFKHVQPRNLGELPEHDTDIVLSSGGPGAPTDGYEDKWCTEYRKFLDGVVTANATRPLHAPKVLLICHSFEIGVLHFGLARMEQRPTKKFGLMPAYMTPEGEATDFLRPFGYRLFSWEHRDWEAVGLDEERLRELGGAVLATETHHTHEVHKGDALLALRFANGMDGTQFHPEADKPGVMAWVDKPESQEALRKAYGSALFERMVKSVTNRDRLAKTFALLIPGWLTYRFNELAPDRGWTPLAPPVMGMLDFDVAV